MSIDPNAPELTTLSNNSLLEVFSGNDIKRIKYSTLVSSLNSSIGGGNYDYYSVKSYGAKGDDTTDDTLAIIDTYNNAGSNGVVYFPTGTYKITSKITVLCDTLSSPMAVIDNRSSDIGIQIGNGTDQIYAKHFDLPSIFYGGTRWYSSGLDIGSDTGIKVINCTNSTIRFNYIYYHSIGIELNGNDDGCYNNVITGNRIFNNAIGMKLSYSGSGFVSESVFNVKEVTIGNGILSGRLTGTRGILKETPNSSLIFNNIDLEGNRLEYVIEVTGNGGAFNWCRFESSDNVGDPNKVLLVDDANGWFFNHGNNLDSVTFDTSGTYSTAKNAVAYIDNTDGTITNTQV